MTPPLSFNLAVSFSPQNPLPHSPCSSLKPLLTGFVLCGLSSSPLPHSSTLTQVMLMSFVVFRFLLLLPVSFEIVEKPRRVVELAS